MILKADQIAKLLDKGKDDLDPLVIVPEPDLKELGKSGAASVDLRLGTWFLTFRQVRESLLDVTKGKKSRSIAEKLTKMHYVPFGKSFILHPRSFVLGITLEWVRLKKNLAGIVTGRSSWGRRGLIIATATGVHPGFTGCLTLELTNLGEIPIAIEPGMAICQLFLHQVHTQSGTADKSSFVGRRRPVLGEVKLDPFAKKLSRST